MNFLLSFTHLLAKKRTQTAVCQSHPKKSQQIYDVHLLQSLNRLIDDQNGTVVHKFCIVE